MEVYPITREDGKASPAFEIENLYIGTTAITRILKGVNGVTEIEIPRIFTRNDGVHVDFKFRGHPYIVWEPYGDNSRYWIGPKEDPLEQPADESLKKAFEKYRVPHLRKFIADWLTLKFLRNIATRFFS